MQRLLGRTTSMTARRPPRVPIRCSRSGPASDPYQAGAACTESRERRAVPLLSVIIWPAQVGGRSMAWSGDDLLAFGFVGAAFAGQCAASFVDVSGERFDLLTAQSLFDQRPHDRDVLGVW